LIQKSIRYEVKVKKLMLNKIVDKTYLPIAFGVYVGAGTKIVRSYHVMSKQVGHLNSYVPAVNEKGKMTYREVYLVEKSPLRFKMLRNKVLVHGSLFKVTFPYAIY